MYVGVWGTGTFTQSAGTNTIRGPLYLGFNSTGNGTFKLSGGSLSISTVGMDVGYGGAGAVVQTGGYLSSGPLALACSSNTIGTYTLTAGTLSAPSEIVGSYGTGTFTQSGSGSQNGVGTIYIGYGSAANGTYNLSSGSLAAGNEYVGFNGTGNFTQSGGASGPQSQFNPAWLYLGYKSTGVGTYSLTAGALSTAEEYVGYSGTGTFTQSGGINTTVVGLELGCTATAASGSYNLNGGTLVTSAVSQGSGSATFNFGGGTLQASAALSTTLPMTLTGTGGSASVNTNGNAVTLSGALSGPGGLNKLGLGTLTLSGLNGYAGLTAVEGGTLWLGTAALRAGLFPRRRGYPGRLAGAGLLRRLAGNDRCVGPGGRLPAGLCRRFGANLQLHRRRQRLGARLDRQRLECRHHHGRAARRRESRRSGGHQRSHDRFDELRRDRGGLGPRRRQL